MKRPVPAVVPSGEIVSVKPALLNVKAAALYCACSPGYLNALRAADVKRRAAGEVMVGPEWQSFRWGVRYRLESLTAWLERSGVPFGVMESRRRAPAPTTDEMAEAAQP